MTAHASICRFCNAHCPITVEIEDGRPTRVTGNKNSPVFDGFCCTRGQALPEQLLSPNRLLHPHKRRADGGFEHISAVAATDEIAARVSAIIEEHGPASVALYLGTYSTINPASTPVSIAWMEAIGSPMMFNSGTIDQPGKHMAQALLGGWQAGVHNFVGSDVWMLIGANPLVSIGITIPAQNPGRHLTDAIKAGMKLIVIDPRRTETARRAHTHIQSRPGQDAVLLAGIIRLILDEGLADADFMRENVAGAEALRAALAPFTLDRVAARADVPADRIADAARTFANARRGLAVGSTGANMSGRSTLTEYLILCLNTICGRYNRAGEAAANPGVLLPRALPKAQPSPAYSPTIDTLPLSVRGLSMTVLGMPTAALADEILAGNIRALFSLGGNPAVAWPDQNRSIAALEALDLFVQLDIKMSASAKLADYVVPPRITLETPTVSQTVEGLEMVYAGWGYSVPFGMYVPALLDPPEGSDLLEEWQLFYGLAQRMGLGLTINPNNHSVNSCPREPREPIALDMANMPTIDGMIEILTRGSRIPLDEVKAHPDGALFPETILAAPKDADCTAKLDIGNTAMMAELAEIAPGLDTADADHPYVFVGRRMAHVYNSSGRDLPMIIRKGGHTNPAFMNPADMEALGVADGDMITIRSRHGSIPGIVQADETLRTGLVSMSHAFGDLPSEHADPRLHGSNTSQLTSVDDAYDRYSGIPLMSAVPVAIARAA